MFIADGESKLAQSIVQVISSTFEFIISIHFNGMM